MKKKKQRKSFRHLNQFDRDRIEALRAAGHRQKEIAAILGVDTSAISREIKKRKLRSGRYDATRAQMKANAKRSHSKYQGMKIEKYPPLRNRIIIELKDCRSPDEIAGHMRREGYHPRVGTNAIYKWLYSPYGQAYCRYLCTKRYKKRKQKKLPKREMIPNRIPLEQRPNNGEHAEGDLFVSPLKTGTTRSGAIICVPSAHLLAGVMIANKKPAVMAQAVQNIVSNVSVDDLTLDNGIENRQHEHFGIPAYFADPHSPWQKPHVENGIGLLRRWFIPKKTDLRTVSEEQLQWYLHRLNRKYRKSLGYRSAYEVALDRGIIQKIPLRRGGNKHKEIAFH